MGHTHSIVQRKLQHCRHEADSHTAAVYTKAGRKHKGGRDNTPKDSQRNIKQCKVFCPRMQTKQGQINLATGIRNTVAVHKQ